VSQGNGSESDAVTKRWVVCRQSLSGGRAYLYNLALVVTQRDLSYNVYSPSVKMRTAYSVIDYLGKKPSMRQKVPKSIENRYPGTIVEFFRNP
jgi:hypothetical protein